jgi:hypothetical protein
LQWNGIGVLDATKANGVRARRGWQIDHHEKDVINDRHGVWCRCAESAIGLAAQLAADFEPHMPADFIETGRSFAMISFDVAANLVPSYDGERDCIAVCKRNRAAPVAAKWTTVAAAFDCPFEIELPEHRGAPGFSRAATIVDQRHFDGFITERLARHPLKV